MVETVLLNVTQNILATVHLADCQTNFEEFLQKWLQLVKRKHVGTIRLRFGRIGMRFNKQPIDASGHAGGGDGAN